jgi:cytochrome oxidase Cu insertion factor (SCO1/SenC/PrrC family)
MALDPKTLEPAIRDPRKLRRTAFILVAIMIIGGPAILYAYSKMAKKQAYDPRPPIYGRLNENLAVVRQDGSAAGLLELDNCVWLACAVSVNQPDSWKRSREVMQRMQKKYAGNPEVRLVCITVDPEQETPAVLAKAAAEIGAELPTWWFAGAGADFTQKDLFRKYLKDKFKLGVMPSFDAGKWAYNPKIMVVDRNRHLRQGKFGRAPFDFDFDAAASYDAKGLGTGTDKSNEALMEEVLIQTIDALLLEPHENS